MSDGTDDSSVWSGPFAPLQKPLGPFRSLPVTYRWEVTRRHPYYQQAWELARRFFLQEPCPSPREQFFREYAVQVLGGIGVGRVPLQILPWNLMNSDPKRASNPG